jgi:hypothetical protein
MTTGTTFLTPLAARNIGGFCVRASRFGKVPHVAGAIIEGSLCFPLQLDLCSPNLSNTEAHVTRSASHFTSWDLPLRRLLQT